MPARRSASSTAQRIVVVARGERDELAHLELLGQSRRPASSRRVRGAARRPAATPPSSVTSPASASMRPSHSEMAVDLPAPLGPSTASNSPAAHFDVDAGERGRRCRNFLVMPRSCGHRAAADRQRPVRRCGGEWREALGRLVLQRILAAVEQLADEGRAHQEVIAQEQHREARDQDERILDAPVQRPVTHPDLRTPRPPAGARGRSSRKHRRCSGAPAL